jgi:hypothetical protein
MLRTVEATIDKNGKVSLSEPVTLKKKSRALLTILDAPVVDDVTLLSEAALSDWNRPEEDEAWAYLQPARSSSSRSRSAT